MENDTIIDECIGSYGVSLDGPIPIDSRLHELYMIQTLPDWLITKRPEWRDTFLQLHRETVCYPWYDPLRIMQLIWYLDLASETKTGDYVECGTSSGASARVIWKFMEQENRLFCFDTFEGFAESDVDTDNALFETNIGVNFIPTRVLE